MNILMLTLITSITSILVVWLTYQVLKYKNFEVPKRFFNSQLFIKQTRNLILAYSSLSMIANIIVESFIASSKVGITMRLSTFVATYFTVGTL